jgi:hypothetical protein
LTSSTSGLGVCISRGDGGQTVIAPDEARTIACTIEDEDSEAATKLRHYAGEVEKIFANPKRPAGMVPVPPKITGAEALRYWTMRYRTHFAAAYRQAGIEDAVILASPQTESLDDPPTDFRYASLTVANEILKTVHARPEGPPHPGQFYVLATRSEGRFEGSFLGMMPAPSADADLPAVTVGHVPTVTAFDNPFAN